MDTRTVLIVVSVFSLVIVVCLVLLIRIRAARPLNKSVDATVTQIKVEASSMSNWWVIIAQWSDPWSGQTLIFRSEHLRFPPKHHIGERITVKFDAARPRRYHMEL
jgi:hypothetical protein